MGTTPSVLSAVEGAASVATPWGAIAALGGKLLNFIPDPVQKAAAAQAIAEEQLAQMTASIDLQKTQMNDASQNILHDGLGGVRKFFGYSFVVLLIWNYAVVPMLHKPPLSIPVEFTVAFTTLLLGTSAMNLAQKVSAMPGDSSVSVLGIKVGNKS